MEKDINVTIPEKDWVKFSSMVQQDAEGPGFLLEMLGEDMTNILHNFKEG